MSLPQACANNPSRHSPQTRCHCPSGYNPADISTQTSRSKPPAPHCCSDGIQHESQGTCAQTRYHRQHSCQFAVCKTIHHKIIASNMIPPARKQSDTRPVVQTHAATLLHPLPNSQTFLAPEPSHALMIQMPSIHNNTLKCVYIHSADRAGAA